MDSHSALEQAITIARARAEDRTPIVGVAGPQGSGKTTLAKAYAAAHPRAAALSLDDVYLPASLRRLLADEVHPLFATRGPPGTHNLTQLEDVLDALRDSTPEARTELPAFDKVTDNPAPRSRRTTFAGRPEVILLDGWCLGATAQSEADLAQPVNDLEAMRDADGVWRREVNANLAGAYQSMFGQLDAILYLEPPSFELVLDWRCEQEAGLLGRPLTADDRARVERFISHFERITRHMIAGGRHADVVVALDQSRNAMGVRAG